MTPTPRLATQTSTPSVGIVERGLASRVRASVIVVSYNGRDALRRCLGSVRVALGADAEVIVVDNASSDDSADRVAESFPQVRLIRGTANQGFGAACNLGARHARGTYLAFLNPDTVVEPNWLDELIRAMEETPDAGLATSRILLLNAPGRINAAGNDTHFTGLTLCRGAGRPRELFGERAEVGAVSGASFAVRRSLFEALGGFDESFFLYLEDTDLSWRARLAGYRCVYVPGSVIYHDYALRFGPRKTFYQERNRGRMLLKTLRWRTFAVLGPGLLLAELVSWSFVLLRERQHLANKLRAYAWILQHWSDVKEARRRTQALRRRDDRELIAGCGWYLAFEQTGDGAVTKFAHRLLDPAFRALHHLALTLIRW